jgi:hypothetical protein
MAGRTFRSAIATMPAKAIAQRASNKSVEDAIAGAPLKERRRTKISQRAVV